MVEHTQLFTQAEELADVLMECPEVAAYREAEQKLSEHKDAMHMMEQLRTVSAQIAEFQARNVPEAYYQHLADESESLLANLEKIPEVQIFQSAQSALNELLQDVTSRLSRSVFERITGDSGG